MIMFFGTFSKILSPGLRIAWIAGNEDLLLKFAYLKQASDLHTSTISQYQIDAFMEMNDIDARAVLTRAIEKGVAFVPGDAFYPNGGHENTLA